MRKICFVVLLVFTLTGVFGQTRAENTWILGTWFGTDIDNENYELVLNDNGTGRFIDWDGSTYFIIYSIVDDTLIVFTGNGYSVIIDTKIYRISDQRMILNIDIYNVNFVKRN